ncbi:hypothetical protein TNIN_10851 [Trichonephila inaurata madagascariensis]|uniref:Uncharacterized protein n=1 Tax=Trichonephila inaurata madagascariensis TaxID=2747483 RepID=A0A8X7C5K6_9ARAC|nr:hypothetical protein TNIN_10851 [Trichonephila inaurata madagascariensis]
MSGLSGMWQRFTPNPHKVNSESEYRRWTPGLKRMGFRRDALKPIRAQVPWSLLMRDNTTPYRTEAVEQLLEIERIQRTDWLENFPDQNPNEHA